MVVGRQPRRCADRFRHDHRVVGGFDPATLVESRIGAAGRPGRSVVVDDGGEPVPIGDGTVRDDDQLVTLTFDGASRPSTVARSTVRPIRSSEKRSRSVVAAGGDRGLGGDLVDTADGGPHRHVVVADVVAPVAGFRVVRIADAGQRVVLGAVRNGRGSDGRRGRRRRRGGGRGGSRRPGPAVVGAAGAGGERRRQHRRRQQRPGDDLTSTSPDHPNRSRSISQ